MTWKDGDPRRSRSRSSQKRSSGKLVCVFVFHRLKFEIDLGLSNFNFRSFSCFKKTPKDKIIRLTEQGIFNKHPEKPEKYKASIKPFMFLFFTELAEKHPANSFCLFGIEKFDLRGVSGHGIFVEVILLNLN
jgi:hypothetical protein